ncbi:MAG: hypothetical protein ACOYKK_04110 [Microbacteriaceae bacterium]
MSEVVRVNTVELESLATAWAQLAHTFDEWCESWQLWCTEAGPSELDIERRHGERDVVAQRARVIQFALRDVARRLSQAAQTYAEVEAVNTVLFQRASDICLWLAGRLLPVVVCLLGPIALSQVVSVGVSRVLLSALPDNLRNPLQRAQTEAWARALSTPAVVRAIERGIGSLDEGALGAIGAPLSVALIVGGAGVGVTSLAGTSRLASRINAIAADPTATLASSLGAGPGATSSIERLSSEEVRPPRDLAEALSRIPNQKDDGAQIRIEQFGETHIVYIGGTVDASLGSGPQPWDMSSNLAALGGDPSASEDAVRRAMAESGIGAGDQVLLVGHSQGGLLAMRVAQSTDVSAAAVVTAGAPVHALVPPGGVPVVAYEHTDDLVPALSGIVTDAQPGLVYVRGIGAHPDLAREDTLLPAHRLDAYVETAQLSDGVGDPTVNRVRDEFARLSTTGTSTLWRATRNAGGK